MVDPQIRAATPADVPELNWLESLARELLVGRRGGDLWLAEMPAQHPDWPAVGAGDVLVSVIDGVPVGYLRFAVRDDVVHVEDVFVHPGAREVGCGEWLLAATIETGRSRGAGRIEAVALPGDRATKNLYERAAITATRIIVSAPIDRA